ncbi:MAG TPA: hypothetical protein DCY23_03165 [Ruminococcaceae bacterium]|nr:hypothetical protein [Oscillospiraceae bacterium]
MKRLISAAILFVFVIAAYSVSLWYITDACKETKALIDECEEAYKNGGDAYNKAEELKRLWDKKEGPLSFFVTHDSIDEIELAISELCVYSKAEEENDFKERIENIKMLLHQVGEDTTFSMHSVF